MRKITFLGWQAVSLGLLICFCLGCSIKTKDELVGVYRLKVGETEAELSLLANGEFQQRITVSKGKLPVISNGFWEYNPKFEAVVLRNYIHVFQDGKPMPSVTEPSKIPNYCAVMKTLLTIRISASSEYDYKKIK